MRRGTSIRVVVHPHAAPASADRAPADNGNEDKSSSLVETVAAGIVVAMAPTLVFCAGWVFLKSYLSPFGIQISELSLDAWEIAALSLSGFNVEGSDVDTVLNLAWLWLMLIGVVLWLIASWYLNGRYRTWLRIVTALAFSLSILQFVGAIQRLSDAGEGVARAVLEGQGVLFVPFVTEEGADVNSRAAMNSCISGERLRPVFITSENSWAFCRSKSLTNKGFIFVVNQNGQLASLRRVGIEAGM